MDAPAVDAKASSTDAKHASSSAGAASSSSSSTALLASAPPRAAPPRVLPPLHPASCLPPPSRAFPAFVPLPRYVCALPIRRVQWLRVVGAALLPDRALLADVV